MGQLQSLLCNAPDVFTIVAQIVAKFLEKLNCYEFVVFGEFSVSITYY